jgi:hypothetical protein
LAGLLACTGKLTATALVPPAAGGVSLPPPPGRSDLSPAAALVPPAAGGADLSARLPFSDLAAAANSLVLPAAGGMGPLFRCSRRALPTAAALVPPAASGAGPARSPSSVLLLAGSPVALPLSSRPAAAWSVPVGSAPALLSCCPAFAASDSFLAARGAAENALILWRMSSGPCVLTSSSAAFSLSFCFSRCSSSMRSCLSSSSLTIQISVSVSSSLPLLLENLSPLLMETTIPSSPPLLLPLLLLDRTRVLFFFAGAFLAGDSFSFLSKDLSSLLPRLDTLPLRRRLSVDDTADRDLDGGPLLLFLALRTGDGDSSLFSLTLRTGDDDLSLFSLTLRIGDGDSRRRLPGDSATGVAARGRLDEDIEDPADSPFPRVSFLLIPLILVPTASGSARPYRSCPR